MWNRRVLDLQTCQDETTIWMTENFHYKQYLLLDELHTFHHTILTVTSLYPVSLDGITQRCLQLLLKIQGHD